MMHAREKSCNCMAIASEYFPSIRATDPYFFRKFRPKTMQNRVFLPRFRRINSFKMPRKIPPCPAAEASSGPNSARKPPKCPKPAIECLFPLPYYLITWLPSSSLLFIFGSFGKTIARNPKNRVCLPAPGSPAPACPSCIGVLWGFGRPSLP
jgi:hypothetical protein